MVHGLHFTRKDTKKAAAGIHINHSYGIREVCVTFLRKYLKNKPFVMNCRRTVKIEIFTMLILK